MTEDQLERLRNFNKPPVRLLARECLTDLTPRTLVYGYFTDRSDLHVYLAEDGRIHRVVYVGDTLAWYGTEETLTLESFTVSKRLYPECCDFEFCQVLKEHDVSLPFTTYVKHENRPFFGKRREELIAVPENFLPLKVHLDYKALGLKASRYGLATNRHREEFQNWLDERLTDIATGAYLRMSQLKGYQPAFGESLRGIAKAVMYWDLLKRGVDGPTYPEYVMPDELVSALAVQVRAVVTARLAGDESEKVSVLAN